MLKSRNDRIVALMLAVLALLGVQAAFSTPAQAALGCDHSSHIHTSATPDRLVSYYGHYDTLQNHTHVYRLYDWSSQGGGTWKYVRTSTNDNCLTLPARGATHSH